MGWRREDRESGKKGGEGGREGRGGRERREKKGKERRTCRPERSEGKAFLASGDSTPGSQESSAGRVAQSVPAGDSLDADL